MVALVVSACGGGPRTQPPGSATGSPASESSVRAVVSLPIFASLVAAVGGDRVTVTSIVPPGMDAHTYQPTPGNIRAVADADVVFVNGIGLETWLQPLIESAGGSTVPVVALAEGLQTVDDPHDAEDGHAHEEGNPHLWLDPSNAAAYVERIAQVLAEHDPAGAPDYRENADRYVAEIESFDAWAKEQIETIPPQRRKLVTFHDAYPYFANHYGLELVGVVVTSPGQDPSPRQVATLVDRVKAEQVPAIFVEPQFNPKLAVQIALEAGVKTILLYSDTPPAGEDYLAMMRLNIEHVVEGLR